MKLSAATFAAFLLFLTKPALAQDSFVAHQCIVAVEASARWLTGAIRNTCSFPVNFSYCLMEHNLVRTLQDCREHAYRKRYSISAFETINGDTRTADGKGLAVFACRAPKWPQEVEIVGGRMRGHCGDDDSTVASDARPRAPRPTVAPQAKTKPAIDSPRTQPSSPNSQGDWIAVPAPTCKVWWHQDAVPNLISSEWQGGCVNGFASGPGKLVARFKNVQHANEWEGVMRYGAKSGRWKWTFGDTAYTEEFNMNCAIPGTVQIIQCYGCNFVRGACTPVRP